MTTTTTRSPREDSPTEPSSRVKKAPVASDRRKAENRLGQRLVLPALLLMLLVTAWPMLQALWLSLFRYRLTSPDDREMVGLGNYAAVFSDPIFWRDTGNTVLIMVVTVSIEFVIGLAFALVMHRVVFARGLVRTSILIPYGIITVVSAFAWQFAFSANNGFVNLWLPFIEDNFDWFGSYGSSMTAIMISEIWKTTPFMSLLLLAGLAQVSEDTLEAAKVDGATWWQRLFKVILPNMRSAIMVAVLFRALDAYRVFDNIYVMTRGANSTESVSFLTYRQSIELLNIGMGSALSVVLFLSVLLIAALLVKVFKVNLAQARGEG